MGGNISTLKYFMGIVKEADQLENLEVDKKTINGL
jgi:hypothetical protein